MSKTQFLVIFAAVVVVPVFLFWLGERSVPPTFVTVEVTRNVIVTATPAIQPTLEPTCDIWRAGITENLIIIDLLINGSQHVQKVFGWNYAQYDGDEYGTVRFDKGQSSTEVKEVPTSRTDSKTGVWFTIVDDDQRSDDQLSFQNPKGDYIGTLLACK